MNKILKIRKKHDSEGIIWTVVAYRPASEPDMAASSVETWKRRSASSTSASVANGSSRILARDSEIRIMASSCLVCKFYIRDER